MPDVTLLLIAIIAIALVFDYTNGAHDAANAIATVVSTKVLSPVAAVVMAAVLNLVGAFLGTKVAHTVGAGIVNTEMVMGCQTVVLAALIAAILWNVLTWCLGLPSSSSHALIGGLMGAALTHGGWRVLHYDSIVLKILLPIVLSPLAGFVGGYVFMVILAWIFCKTHPRNANRAFRRLQLVASAFMATSHGTNDAQKTMGIITLALFVSHQIPAMHVPFWVVLACAFAMMLGTATGGWRIIKTMGHSIFKMEPVHGFATATSASVVIFGASFLGAPISTTHTISSCVLGVGASKRLSAVRWGIARSMIVAWVLTIPATALVGALCFCALRLVGLAT